MGFKDGTNNPPSAATDVSPDRPRSFDDVVWVGDEGPDWMRGGSYLVARRIRISLEHWDRSEIDFQEQVIGRHKYSGAPIGKTNERDSLDLDRVDADGNPLIADNAHVRLGAAATNGGAQIFRRPYSYNDGVRFTAERWPPWRQGMMYDAGLFFICYQRDPREGFIKIYRTWRSSTLSISLRLTPAAGCSRVRAAYMKASLSVRGCFSLPLVSPAGGDES